MSNMNSDVYEKSYKQLKNEYTLPKITNRYVHAVILSYSDLKQCMEAFNDRSEQQISEDEIVYYMDFEHQFNALNNALYQYVKAEYREVIREHLENQIPWAVLAEKYSFSTRDLQRQWSRYRYGVAKELGYKVRTYASISR